MTLMARRRRRSHLTCDGPPQAPLTSATDTSPEKAPHKLTRPIVRGAAHDVVVAAAAPHISAAPPYASRRLRLPEKR